MTPAETVHLLKVVAAVCPAMKLEPETAEAWYLVLGDLDQADCLAVIRPLGKRLAFIAPADIAREVQALRAGRLAAAVEPTPDGDPDDWPAWMSRRRANLQAIASGREAPHQLADGARALPVGDDGKPDITRLCPMRTIPGSSPVTNPDRERRKRIQAVPCPWHACRAGIDQPCIGPDGKPMRNAVAHPGRLAAAGEEIA